MGMTDEPGRMAFQGAVAFLTGDNTAAIDHYRQSLKQLRQQLKKRKVFLVGIHGLFFLFALLGRNDAALIPEIQAGLDTVTLEGNAHWFGFLAMQTMVWTVQGLGAKARSQLRKLRIDMPVEPLSAACVALAESVCDPKLARQHRQDTEARAHRLRPILPLVAHIHEGILARIEGTPMPPAPWPDFTMLILVRPSWERAFDSLTVFLRSGKPRAPERVATTPGKRLAWFLNPEDHTVEVLEQSHQVRKGWTAGRAVAMKRLHEQDPRLNYLTDHDRRVLRTLRKESNGWSDDYYFDLDRTILALIGHPALFDARHRDRSIELVAYPMELVVTGTRDGYHFALSHSHGQTAVFIEEETPSRFRVIEFSQQALALREVLGPRGLDVPRQARERVMALLREQGLALPLRAEAVEGVTAVIPGNTVPVVQLRPLAQGLRVSLLVQPFVGEGPYFLPGQGSKSVLATLATGQQRADRDLEAERRDAQAVVSACPLLPLDGGHEGVVEGMESCLELLLELQSCPLPLIIQWPEGKPLRVHPPLAISELKLNLKQTRDWFHVEGEVRLNQGQVLAMGELIKRLDQAHGRFIPLDGDRFVALTSHFRQQLERLRGVTESGLRLAPLGALAIQEMVDEAGEVQADHAWRELMARIRQAEDHRPAMPSTLQAELRDYQVEGFHWLSRLAQWGAGACLADDMGLGKTVQALAVMLEQGPRGPCLVVAPTSVCHNWERELARFAPALTVHRLSEATDRAALLAMVGAMDVVVASYGLLASEGERLAEVAWQMLVLDEAQAIKNAETRRAQASRKVNAVFRLALSGTPIENYLDELWSLFQVINPGLLGSRESFQKRFATPIERDRSTPALHALRALIRPFILRRTKSMVLAELPPRTDITLEVTLPEDERAFQEALRRKAVATLENMGDDDLGQRRFRILAEITRLRRACCHPGLVDGETTLPGAKLTLFLELAEELIRNRHKALVFSQFVGQLERVRGALDSRGVSYQYLDGSTPAREREKRVQAFQTGSGDLFLISLKAGGLGLNLTAADYVIHLDPWWNPAVEDQASDRAHRIGQNRPVTVYRLIVQESIEEKILRLHQDKRDLADALLEGTDASARLSEEELLTLLRG